MGRSTVHYTDDKTNNSLKKLHKLLRPAGTPVQRVEYIIELLLLRIFEVKLRRDGEFSVLRQLFTDTNEELKQEKQKRLFSYLKSIDSASITSVLNTVHFPFYGNIVTEVGQIIKNTELTPKVMDELVLIQSVFSNSNFTNNVIGGNLQEVITEVSNLDEALLVKTDLLGDAIESALSETGGTKDIGLYRTPDHIRQFMVGLLEPTIDDLIMDPACGTGGFLFDSYEFVLDRCEGEDAIYPGEKAHPELREWFKNYFAQLDEDWPNDMQTQNFYRHGVFGVEYLGMIKKMAAVNLYIRGLNPRNIEQGDSLNKFGTSIMPNSKTVILANPPFGAETDQTSYPNVWEDFSTEKETTILFVKLMLDSLRDGGRCAVIVSEGFLTWDQTSAKTLREMLLNQANLKAVIGLPQGVFVSKSGVGPKTSILLFEKGQPTTKTWFYQVQDDGYTMGTNRKPKSNSQLVDALNIYHTYIKQGLTPPEKSNSFMIDASWIKSIDPRIKRKIRQEVEETNGIKQQNDVEKKTTALFRKVKAKQISEKEMKFELKQVDELWKGKTDAEIEQKTTKAYSFSYNPTTYHSMLNDTQLKAWTKLIGDKTPDNIESLDIRFRELYTAELGEAFAILSRFNLSNAIEADIVREYVSNYISKEALEAFPQLKKIDEIFKMGAKYPMVKLAPYLIENTEKVKPNKLPETRWRTLGVSNEIGVFINENATPEETNQSYYLVKKNEFCYNPYRVNVGSIGLNKHDYDNQIISGAYVVFGTKEDELLPEYLEILIKDKHFNDYVATKANVGNGVRMNFTFEDMGNWEIPLPSIQEQEMFISKYSKSMKLISASKDILSNLIILDVDNTLGEKKYPLDELITVNATSIDPKKEFADKEFIYVDISSVENGTGVIDYSNKLKGENAPSRAKRVAKKNDVIISTVRPNLKGFSFLDESPTPNTIYSTGFAILSIKDYDKILPKYLYILFMNSDDLMLQMKKVMEKSSYPSINKDDIKSFIVSVPTIKQQESIIEEWDNAEILKEKLNIMCVKAQNKVNLTLKNIWGEEE
ncbi:N-6 DNA methylase [uncultured Phascolarctobacterium sp.]|uniref:N-6 DNA methylase n=1 Tax=uncultured Phascolarctobacterium sp. TaxID=512296 RepID=UPI0015AA7FF4|nr:N-6 DNA methylase [uncultured Phascolarctobacterium sp.]